MFTPETLDIVMVSFEGPDQYSQAGGLGVRARELCRAFAGLGYRTTLVFVGDPDKPGLFVQMLTLLKGTNFSRPHVHPGPLFTTVLSGTWWVGTGNKYDPANLTVPMKQGTFVTHFGNRVHWDGAKDEDVTLLIIGEGPVTTARVDETR